MKILMVTDKMDIGGAETHIFTLIAELIRQGDSVTILSAGGTYARDLKKLGAEVRLAPLDRRDPISVVRSTRTLSELMRLCDVVHTHTRFSSFLAKHVRGRKSFPPIVVTAHLTFKLFPFGRLAFWGEGTLAVSEDIKEYLIRNYGLTDSDVRLTRNCIDLEKFDGERKRRKLIIHTSRIDKGRSRTAFLLCDVAEELLAKHTDWRILIVGDGNLYARLKKRARDTNGKLGFEGVILCGARYDIPAILRYGAIFVGVSRAALEGMAVGLPTVISGDEGYGGILSFDNYSLLFKTNFCARGLQLPTKELLKNDIEFLINNETTANSLSAYAKKAVADSFAPALMAGDAIACYKLTRSAPSLCLLGYFGYGNLGDEEILNSAISVLKGVGISKLSILVENKKSAARAVRCPSDICVSFFDRMDPIDLKRAIDSTDALVLCGGNLLQNETSLASLIYYSQLVKYAASRKSRVYVLSGGFGDLRGAYAKYLAAHCLSRTDFCGCRTSFDLEFARQYARVSALMPDLCFLLEKRASKTLKNSFCWVFSAKAAICPSDIINIALERKLTPIAVSLNPNDDIARYEEIKKHGIRIFTPRSYEEFSSLMGSCAFTLSERLHGAIFSLTSRTPAYLTCNSSKKAALIADVGAIIPGAGVLISYSKSAVLEKKEIGATDSDFLYLIEYMRRDIYNALSMLFD